MAFTEGSNDGTLNGTLAVTVVAAPSNGVRRLVRTITIYNADTVRHLVTLRLNNNGTYRTLWKGTLAIGDTLIFNDPLVLDTTTKSIEALMGEAATTSNPDFTAHWGDAS